MSPGPTFDRVYHALKERLGGARFAAGEHLEPATLSCELNASITPVRDALHRLVGEGLVEAPRGDGFRTPLVTEVGLRHLYRWNATLLALAARARGAHGGYPVGPTAPADPLETIGNLFLGLARRTGNPEHVEAIARLNDRLRPIRQREATFLPDLDAEIASIEGLLLEEEWPALRRALAAFHRRRERIVAELVASLVKPR